MKKIYIMVIVISSQLMIAQKDVLNSPNKHRRGNTIRSLFASICGNFAESHQKLTEAEANVWKELKSDAASLSH